MANEEVDITPYINHPLIYQPHGISEPFHDFNIRELPVQHFYDPLHNSNIRYTNEKHRTVFTNCVILCYDVRDFGYILTETTFEEDNMVIVNDHDIKFKNLYAVLYDEDDDQDFLAVADLIENLVLPHNIPDVDVFLSILRDTGVDAPSKEPNNHIVRCNYALMSNIMRRDFLTLIWTDAQNNTLTNQNNFNNACNGFLPPNGWRREARRVPGSPVADVFNFRSMRYYNTPYSCLKFIRHSLVHLCDWYRGAYHPWYAYLIMDSYFGEFMANIQSVLYNNLQIMTIEELHQYEPSP